MGLPAWLLEEVSYRFADLKCDEVSREALALETWRMNFGGSLVRNARFVAKRSLWRRDEWVLGEVSCETLVLETWGDFSSSAPPKSRKSPTKLPSKSVVQSPTSKSAPQECLTRLSYKTHKSLLQECPTKVSDHGVVQECPTRVSHNSVPQECRTSVFHESVL